MISKSELGISIQTYTLDTFPALAEAESAVRLELISQALLLTKSYTEAALLLGIDRKTLYTRMKQLDIRIERKGSPHGG